MQLISDEELAHMRERAAQSEGPKSKAQILVEVVKEEPTLTVRELAEAAERSQSWVRRMLRLAGITLVKPTRPKRQRITGRTLCVCGHNYGTARSRARNAGHCVPGSDHIDADNKLYQCATRHCLGWDMRTFRQTGQMLPCPCENFEPATEKL